MKFRLFRLMLRRRWRKRQRQVEGLSLQAERGLERHFFRRLGSLGRVWRFIAAWVVLLVLLIGTTTAQIASLSSHYQMMQPIPGGTYREGVLGNFTNANPLFATSDVDTTVSKLVFSGLFTYDNHNHLVGDLARGFEVNAKGTVYTVHLKPNLIWQDGQRLTADDVVFTYHTIQDPDVQSPLLSSWQGITVAKKDAYTVIFTLPNPLSSFPYQLINGIVPKHLLDHLPPADLRSADFNTIDPVGSGPFEWSALQVEDSNLATAQVSVALKPFPDYYRGTPKLSGFVVKAFASRQQLVEAFTDKQLNGMAGLDSIPAGLAKNEAPHSYSLELSAATMAFFNTTSPVLSDVKVRQALVRGVDTVAILKHLGYVTSAVQEPLLRGQLAYNPAYRQATYDPAAAKTSLTAAGWVVGEHGIRTKAGQPLEFNFYASNTQENAAVSRELARYWHALGAKVDVRLQNDTDLQNTVSTHSYDVLLYGISIGVDPDVFVYWDSSQTDPRSTVLNLSLYKSATADSALEAGRTRLDPALRTIKYKPFLQAWQQDAPALGLYQPRFLYVANQKVYGLDATIINTGADRFNNVQNWMVRTARVTNG